MTVPTGEIPPIVLLIHRRANALRAVIEALRKVRPNEIYVVADGLPADAPPQLRENIRAARDAIDLIDWPCVIHQIYAEDQLGAQQRILTGLDEVFASTDTAIILEDDCVPSTQFPSFAADLLKKYSGSDRVMSIGGHRVVASNVNQTASYRATRYPSIWGWATWGSAWRSYREARLEMHEAFKDSWFERTFPSPLTAGFWRRALAAEFAGDDIWDYSWTLAHRWRNVVALEPRVNLVTNIGFDSDATHTRDASYEAFQPAIETLKFPLKHPKGLEVDSEWDDRVEEHFYSGMELRRLAIARKAIMNRRRETARQD